MPCRPFPKHLQNMRSRRETDKNPKPVHATNPSATGREEAVAGVSVVAPIKPGNGTELASFGFLILNIKVIKHGSPLTHKPFVPGGLRPPSMLRALLFAMLAAVPAALAGPTNSILFVTQVRIP